MPPRPPSVVHICSASRAVYGAVQSLMTLADAQRQAGRRVEFITFKGKRFGDEVRAAGFRVHEVRVRAKIDPFAVGAMRGILRREQFDVAHTHLSTSSVNGCLAARFAAIPCVATVHGMSGKLSFAAADHLIAVSKQVKSHLVKQGVRPEKVSVVYNGLPTDVPLIDRLSVRASLGLTPEDFVLGTIARVTPAKGIDDAIRLVSLLSPAVPNVRYLVVGDGLALEDCRRLAGELGVADRIHFLGYRKDVAECLAAMDLFVFPTHKEAMGIALVEAMRSGLPAVATDVGGVPEVLTVDCGFLVPDRDPKAMAAKVQELAADPALRSRMGEAARARVGAVFSVEAMRRATEDVYVRLLGQAQAVPREA